MEEKQKQSEIRMNENVGDKKRENKSSINPESQKNKKSQTNEKCSPGVRISKPKNM